MGKQVQPGEMNAVTDYSALIDGAGINVCKLLLDDELTILWANDNFYISSGFGKDEYQTLFHHIKAYYTGHGDEFAKIKKCVLRCIAKGRTQSKGWLPAAA